MKRNKVIFAGLLAAALLFLYWFKCQNEVDFFKPFHLGEVLPVEPLEKHHKVIARSSYAPGDIMLNEDYEKFRLIPVWGRLWSSEPEKIHVRKVREGMGGSLCLRVDTETGKFWNIPHGIIFETRPGDVFRIQVDFRSAHGGQPSASVVLLDSAYQVLQWSFSNIEPPGTKAWERTRGTFRIPEGARFMRLRLGGSEAGTVWFDNVRLECVEKAGG